MSYTTARGRRASTPRTFVLPVTTRKGIKIVPIVVWRQRAAAGLCNGASQRGLALLGTAGLLRGCGSPGHSSARGRAAAVPGEKEGCPRHSPNAQTPQAPIWGCCPLLPSAGSSWLCPLPPVRSKVPVAAPASPQSALPWSSPAPAASPPPAPALTSTPALLWTLSSSPASP